MVDDDEKTGDGVRHEEQGSSREGTGTEPFVVVTGSSGLIGSRVVRELATRYHVVGLDRDPPPHGADASARDLWIECDLTDDASVEHALERLRDEHGSRIASVVHLAAYYDFSGDPSPLYDELTVRGTSRMLKGLEPFDVGQFVFSSSLLVLRPADPGETLDEVSPVGAAWDYPRSKLRAEAVIREERGDISATILRIAGVYDEACHSVPIAQQMRRIYEKKLESLVFPGDPEHGQSFVHLDDLVRCIGAVVDRRARLGEFEVFLVGEADVVSYSEMQSILGEALHGTEWPTVRIPAPIAKAGAWIKDRMPGEDPFIKPWMIDLADAHRPISVAKAEAKLDWTAERCLRDVLPTMARRLLADPRSWYEENGLEPDDDLESDDGVANESPSDSQRRREPSRG